MAEQESSLLPVMIDKMDIIRELASCIKHLQGLYVAGLPIDSAFIEEHQKAIRFANSTQLTLGVN